MRERLPLPKKIADAPELDLGLELYYDAFWELTSCRETGFVMGPIPWTAINDYAEAFGLDEEQRYSLGYLVREMDAAYVEHHRKKTKRGSKPCPTSKGSAKGWGSVRKK